MFVVTVKSKLGSKKSKLVLLCVLCAVVLMIVSVCFCAVRMSVPDTAYCQKMGEYSTAFETRQDIQEFAQQFSLEFDELYSAQQVYIPVAFNSTYDSYNELQKLQGLDLENYKGKRCELYIYKLKDYTIDDAQAYITVVVYKKSVIAGHISTSVEDSTMYTFNGEEYE